MEPAGQLGTLLLQPGQQRRLVLGVRFEVESVVLPDVAEAAHVFLGPARDVAGDVEDLVVDLLLVREVQQGAGHDVFGLFTIEGVVAV